MKEALPEDEVMEAGWGVGLLWESRGSGFEPRGHSTLLAWTHYKKNHKKRELPELDSDCPCADDKARPKDERR